MDLSKLSERLDGQPMFQLLSIAKDLEKQGSKIIHFEIGDPNFGSPKLAIKKLRKLWIIIRLTILIHQVY